MVSYYFIWCTFSLLQTCIWRITGTHAKRKKNSYERAAHVMDVWCRYKFSSFTLPNSVTNFIAVHKGFDHPNIVLRDNVTLYTIQPTYAVFVETDEDVNVTASDTHSFMKAAQYENAKRVIVLPRSAFDRLADEVGAPRAQVIFMGNTMRCGSTLMCQIFEKSERCLAFSEPDVINALHALKDKTDVEDFKHLTKSAVNLLFKPTKAQPAAYMVKITGHSMNMLTTLCEIYPESIPLFMYRDGLPMMQSCSRLMQEEPIARVISAVLELFPSLNHLALSLSGSHNDEIPKAAADTTPFASTSYSWAAMCHTYRKLREQGLPIVAIKYEDLVANPRQATEIIFQHCKLNSTSVDKALRAFQKDSQRNCVISRSNLRKHHTPELSAADKVHTDAICDYYKLPRIPEVCVLEATITHVD